MKARKFNVNVTNHSKIDGHVGYHLKIQIDNNTPFFFFFLYSELKTLNDLLRKETSNNSFPKFPPKKFFGFNSEDFVRKRQQELDTYFQSICNSPEFSKLKSFNRFIDDCLKSQKENKIMSERPTAVPDIQPKTEKKAKSVVNTYKEKYRPNKNDFTKLSLNESKKEEEQFIKIVNDTKSKFIEIDFQVKQNISEHKENKYKDIITEDNILGKEIENDNLEGGNDDNFNLISDNFDEESENNVRQKMEDTINKGKEMDKIYDINEILKTL